MIRIRCADSKGTIIDLPKNAAFIELCDEDGKIAAVVSYNHLDKSVNVFDGDSDKANRYRNFFKTEFISKKHNITNLYKKDTQQN